MKAVKVELGQQEWDCNGKPGKPGLLDVPSELLHPNPDPEAEQTISGNRLEIICLGCPSCRPGGR